MVYNTTYDFAVLQLELKYFLYAYIISFVTEKSCLNK